MNPAFLIPLLSLAPLATARDELLPSTPEGWQYERIDFPLAFAPELDYEGFEELRFAPGMFDVASGSYFSYALAIRVEGDLRVDAAFATEFLELYYGGLASAVAEDRGLDVELDPVAVEIEPRPYGFLAHVDTFDAFVTAQPLQLRFELSIHDGPGYAELFGIASPRDEGEPIWDELHGIAESWRAERAAPVYFNHLYVVPDRATYDAVAGSEELRELIVVEERTTVRADFTYTGVYLYGRETYFELLQPNDFFPPGGSGIAFGVEAAGATDAVAANLGEAGLQTMQRDTSRELDGEQIPWFRMLGVQGAHERSRMQLFMLEYVPEFLGTWHAKLPPTGGGIGRAPVLERYAQSLGQGALHPDALIEDVVAIHLALDEKEREHLASVSRALGYRVDGGDEGYTVLGPRYSMVVRPTAEPDAAGGIERIDLSLRREVTREPLAFGRYRMTFDGRSATFHFTD